MVLWESKNKIKLYKIKYKIKYYYKIKYLQNLFLREPALLIRLVHW